MKTNKITTPLYLIEYCEHYLAGTSTRKEVCDVDQIVDLIARLQEDESYKDEALENEINSVGCIASNLITGHKYMFGEQKLTKEQMKEKLLNGVGEWYDDVVVACGATKDIAKSALLDAIAGTGSDDWD